MPANPVPDLHFDVSTGLKRVIGRELITNAEVAIFELVKNSFDANAKRVQIYIDLQKIVVIDDGNGMSFEDIRDKWLFVAYSAKRETNTPDDYRDVIAERRQFAGSKGIGRFSSDRLGHTLILQTRPRDHVKGMVHRLEVDWDQFEKDDREQFVSVPVDYARRKGFELPPGAKKIRHGTILEIRGLRQTWTREELKRLRSSLSKLINPFGAKTDAFRLEVIAPDEVEEDKREKAKAKERGNEIELPPNAVVNGEVRNFIFDTLQERTTFLEIRLIEKGTRLESTLTDRGELVYRVREPSPYEELKNSDFHCQIFYLNQSAKHTFARRMGVPSVQFGSVFLFRNGFRVYPVGDEGDDWFRMDRRKQQGTRRFLGTRDVIGRIDVSGDETDFAEGSSRNQGLVATPATEELRDCFRDKCLRRLEFYVVPVSWADKGDKLVDDLSRLLTDEGRARVSQAVAKLVENPEIELVDYSQKLIQVVNERSELFEQSLADLRAIANKVDDTALLDTVDHAEQRFIQLRKAEEEANRRAEEERVAREAAELRVEAAEQATIVVEALLEEERARNLFLTSIGSLDYDTVVNLHHQITLYASEIGALLENKIAEYKDKSEVDAEDVLSAFEQTIFLNQKILAVARFATKANFKLDSGSIEADVVEFLVQYIEEIGQEYLANRIRILVDNQAGEFIRRFKPIEFSILVDNLVSNSRKSGAARITFEINQPSKSQLMLRVFDNGPGLSRSIKDPEDIFEKGFSMTKGSGLGLYHVRQVLSGMNGSISLERDFEGGTSFLVTFV